MRGVLQRLISRVAALALGASVVLMSFQILIRFFFNAPLTWTEEVDRYLFVWVVYLGSAVAVAMNAHIRVTFVIDWAGQKSIDSPESSIGIASFFPLDMRRIMDWCLPMGISTPGSIRLISCPWFYSTYRCRQACF